MTGIVTVSREAAIRLIVLGPSQQAQEIEALVDTGFNGFITLSTDQVAELSLAYHSRTVVTLADGTHVPLNMYKAAVNWDGKQRTVFALEADGGPLVGMSLLYGSRLIIDIVAGGIVSIVGLKYT